MKEHDTDGNGVLNKNDKKLEAGHLHFMLEDCDSNEDGSICLNELHKCAVKSENEWRHKACPGYGKLYCPT